MSINKMIDEYSQKVFERKEIKAENENLEAKNILIPHVNPQRSEDKSQINIIPSMTSKHREQAVLRRKREEERKVIIILRIL